MKVMIDLIENIRDTIRNDGRYIVTAGLLKEDRDDSSRLIYSGEAPLRQFSIEEEKKQLHFKIGGEESELTIKALLPVLLISGMDKMLYELKIDVNEVYSNMEVVGFGKNDEQKRYILFIKI